MHKSPRTRNGRRQLRILCAAIGMLSAVPCLSPMQGGTAPIPRVAPPFSLPTVDGKVLNLADLKGSVILLEFFQTACESCKVAAPRLELLYEKYKLQGFRVVAVSFDNPNGAVAERVRAVAPFVKQYGLTYPVLLGDRSIWINYIQKPGFNSPLVVFIDRKGQIVALIEEGPDHKACDMAFLENQVKQLLK
jgi:peroxiredoxin